MMRAFIIAPAEMHAHPLCRNVGQRPVQGFDMFGGPLAKLGHFEIRILDVPAHRQVRAIDLQIEASRHDRLVFGPHRIRDRREIGALAPVMVVAEEKRDDARRRRGHERALISPLPDRELQIVDIPPDRVGIGDGDRAVAGRRFPPRPAGIPEHPLRHVRKLDQVLVDE